jgi:hypothetical protein
MQGAVLLLALVMVVSLPLRKQRRGNVKRARGKGCSDTQAAWATNTKKESGG